MAIDEKFSDIRNFLLDMDGVLTDGRVLVLENGLQARHMSIRDGYAIQLAIRKGYHIAVISGADSEPVRERMRRLGVSDVFMSVKDKRAFIDEYAVSKGIRLDQTLFMGDDMPDLPVAGQVGLFCCPADAIEEIRGKAQYISHVNGGMGCVRDVIERVLKLNSDWTTDKTIASS